MGTKHNKSSDPVPDAKRRRRAGSSAIDAGIQANECIKVYMASRTEEVDSPNCFQVEAIDLNRFFEDDGKIYGYQGLKITVWLSSVSFHAYADMSFESSSDGGKGVTDLKSSLQDIFAENLVERKEDFLQTFSTECHFLKSVVSSARVLQNFDSDAHRKEESVDLEVYRVSGTGVGDLYARLVPLVLLLIDGSNPIDVTDPDWEIYMLVQKTGEDTMRFFGFAAIYHFYRYPDSTRFRLGQILIIPPFQRKGYGSTLLHALNSVAISDNVYDLTIEEPVDSLQHVRTCIDVQRLLYFEPIQQALDQVVTQLKCENLSKHSQTCQFGPPSSTVEDVRKSLKINKRQFLQCWEILIYLRLHPIEKYLENYKTIISNRVKADIFGKESEGAGKRVINVPTEFEEDTSFSMFKLEDSDSAPGRSIEEGNDEGNKEEQLKQVVDERIKQIESVARKVSLVKLSCV